ncbi:MAG: tetratricopeptide repeat protein [Candidatus Glassbacteria bacterium]|nr:tetratricopeptide repeat protein [Candidatus Glassbacteria bacterium]
MFKLLFCGCLGFAFLLGCGGASAANRDILGSDVLLLKQDNRRLREEMAALDSLVKNRLQQLDRFNANFGADVRQLNERMSIIEQRLEDLEKKLARVAAGAASAGATGGRPAAESDQPRELQARDIYDLAYKDYTASNYQMAIEGFRDFLSRFPDSPLGAQAYLYIGDSYRSLKKYGEAISNYKMIVDKYQESPEHAEALYKIGDCLIISGDRSRGEIFLQALIQKFPDSKAAALARAKLNP